MVSGVPPLFPRIASFLFSQSEVDTGRAPAGRGLKAGSASRRPLHRSVLVQDPEQRGSSLRAGADEQGGAGHFARLLRRAAPGRALGGALLATFTVTPVLASLLLPEHAEETETLLVRVLRKIYDPLLRFSLGHKSIMVVFGLAFLGLTALLTTRLGSEFLPALEEVSFLSGEQFQREFHGMDSFLWQKRRLLRLFLQA